MKNVIEQKEFQEHTIERYRFKVLGSDNTEEDDNVQDVSQKSSEIVVEPQIIGEGQNKFIEELLSKSDVLSSNIIKLQMQIEKQEGEFQNKLKENVAREKEISSDEGYAKAKEQLESKFEEKVSLYLDSAEKFDEKTKQMDVFFGKLEKNLIETSLELAKEVISTEISVNSQKIATSLAKELMKDLVGVNQITIRVNPKDFDELNSVFKDNKNLQIDSDNAVSLGGVVLLSEKGNLDGNIASRLEKVKYLLQKDEQDKNEN